MLWLSFAIDMVKRGHQFCLFFATVVVEVVGPLCWSNLSHAGFADARTEANKINREIKGKNLKVES